MYIDLSKIGWLFVLMKNHRFESWRNHKKATRIGGFFVITRDAVPSNHEVFSRDVVPSNHEVFSRDTVPSNHTCLPRDSVPINFT